MITKGRRKRERRESGKHGEKGTRDFTGDTEATNSCHKQIQLLCFVTALVNGSIALTIRVLWWNHCSTTWARM